MYRGNAGSRGNSSSAGFYRKGGADGDGAFDRDDSPFSERSDSNYRIRKGKKRKRDTNQKFGKIKLGEKQLKRIKAIHNGTNPLELPGSVRLSGPNATSTVSPNGSEEMIDVSSDDEYDCEDSDTSFSKIKSNRSLVPLDCETKENGSENDGLLSESDFQIPENLSPRGPTRSIENLPGQVQLEKKRNGDLEKDKNKDKDKDKQNDTQKEKDTVKQNTSNPISVSSTIQTTTAQPRLALSPNTKETSITGMTEVTRGSMGLVPLSGKKNRSINEPVPICLFQEKWPDPSPIDDYCFMCNRRDFQERLLTNRFYKALEKLISYYGTMSTFKLCEIIQRYYRQTFQEHQPGQLDWSINSIRKHIEHDGVSNEQMLKNVTRVVHKQITTLTDTGLALYDPDSRRIFANSRGTGHLTKLTKTLISCIRSSR